MTFKELYQRAKNQPAPATPARAFIAEIAKLTKKSEIAVRRWLSQDPNSTVPDDLTQDVLAKHFNTTPEELFPKS